MKQQTIPYFTFSGNCREAMEFYQRCFGGTLFLQTVGESPGTEMLPDFMKQYILHSSLLHEHFMLMGTDMVGDEGLRPGNSVSIYLQCDDVSEMRRYYESLSEGAIVRYPVVHNVWGTWSAELTDKFGHRWILNSG